MAITRGTPGSFPIDFGLSELASRVLGTQVGAYNPAQNAVQGLDTSNSQANVQTLNQGGAISTSNIPASYNTYASGAYAPLSRTTQQVQPTSRGVSPGVPTGGNPLDNIQPTGQSESDINAQFAPIFDIYNQAESNLRGQLPGLISEAEAQAAASGQLLQNQRQQSEAQLAGQESQAGQIAQRQEADQRRIFQELGIANQQRFGGASSAGQAASELQGREFQRSRFGIQEGFQNAIQQINMKKQEVLQNYNQATQQLQVNTQKALGDIRRRFDDKMSEINAGRLQTESQKAIARTEALQELKNMANQIQLARAQYEIDLRNQAQQNAQQISAYEQQLLASLQGGQQATDNFSNMPVSAIPGVEQSNQNTQGAMVGSIGRREDELYNT